LTNQIVTAHTPGPWRWEFNAKHKSVALVGGRPQYDLTVMDFTRWGMGGAVPRVRDLAHDGMNILHRICDHLDWIVPFPNRSHHADWCAALTHADMVLIAAAPDLLEALNNILVGMEASGGWTGDDGLFDAGMRAYNKATGVHP
jgi:hypothetical protein